jgi:hypothetical protein
MDAVSTRYDPSVPGRAMRERRSTCEEPGASVPIQLSSRSDSTRRHSGEAETSMAAFGMALATRR